MTDNGLIRLFLPIINSALLADGYIDVITQQSNQPTMQGINSKNTVFFYKIGDHRYGFTGKYDKWNIINNTMTHTELQVYETTFQVSALALQNPLTPFQYTASDLVNEVASIMQSDLTIDTLMAQNVGILRITDIVNPYFFDDRDNFEASPSFDFTLTYLQTRISVNPVIQSVDYAIYRV
jgi:hypothetical protein